MIIASVGQRGRKIIKETLKSAQRSGAHSRISRILDDASMKGIYIRKLKNYFLINHKIKPKFVIGTMTLLARRATMV